MSRPFRQLGVGELESLFAKSKSDVSVLKQLQHELQYRQVPRAVALLAEVRATMHAGAPSAPALSPPPPAQQQLALWETPVAWTFNPNEAPASFNSPAPTSEAVELFQGRKHSHLPGQPILLDDAHRLLKATAGSSWESIEQTRRQLVQQSSPLRSSSMSPEMRAEALEEARRVNTAYETLWRHRACRTCP